MALLNIQHNTQPKPNTLQPLLLCNNGIVMCTIATTVMLYSVMLNVQEALCKCMLPTDMYRAMRAFPVHLGYTIQGGTYPLKTSSSVKSWVYPGSYQFCNTF